MPRKNKEADKVVDEACLLSLFRQFSPETQTLIINGIKDGRLCKATEVMGEAGIPKSLAERELLKAIRGLPDMKRIMAVMFALGNARDGCQRSSTIGFAPALRTLASQTNSGLIDDDRLAAEATNTRRDSEVGESHYANGSLLAGAIWLP